ncbi:MAG: hypothetical protein WCO04_13420 [Pseudomonadota bacterium]
MALNAYIHWGLILRVGVSQPITQEGWRYLLTEARHPFNFDGEIFGMHSTAQRLLRNFGFRGLEAGVDADFVDVDNGFRNAESVVNWIEQVDVVPLVESVKPFRAWKLKNSGAYTVTNFADQVLTKGTDVDWTPLIGKIY